LHEQLRYGYDKAWNLSWRSNNCLGQSFTANAANELAGGALAGSLTVSGSVWPPPPNSTPSVTVSGTGLASEAAQVYADGSWARAGAAPANGLNTYTAQATNKYSGNSAQSSQSAYLPATVVYAYDANGNLRSDGLRNFQYDYENQLTNVFVPGQWQSTFVYDGLGRRRIRFEQVWNGAMFVTNQTVRYVYDGRLVLQERDGNNNPQVTYTRGLDLSGTREGAGGIGGLLARTANPQLPASTAHAYYSCDGSGNVTCLIDSNNTVVASYRYDPFGNLQAMGGWLAAANLYRFSSKEYHPNSGLVYYLYRYYDPNLQRWINRDPLGLRGGYNLYGFAENNPLIAADPYGLDVDWGTVVRSTWTTCGSIFGGLGGFMAGGGSGLLTGPGAVVASPAAACAGATCGAGLGGAAGYAIGNYIANSLGLGGSGWGGDFRGGNARGRSDSRIGEALRRLKGHPQYRDWTEEDVRAATHAFKDSAEACGRGGSDEFTVNQIL
jgi:RHS repeat-associated protein